MRAANGDEPEAFYGFLNEDGSKRTRANAADIKNNGDEQAKKLYCIDAAYLALKRDCARTPQNFIMTHQEAAYKHFQDQLAPEVHLTNVKEEVNKWKSEYNHYHSAGKPPSIEAQVKQSQKSRFPVRKSTTPEMWPGLHL